MRGFIRISGMGLVHSLPITYLGVFCFHFGFSFGKLMSQSEDLVPSILRVISSENVLGKESPCYLSSFSLRPALLPERDHTAISRPIEKLMGYFPLYSASCFNLDIIRDSHPEALHREAGHRSRA